MNERIGGDITMTVKIPKEISEHDKDIYNLKDYVYSLNSVKPFLVGERYHLSEIIEAGYGSDIAKSVEEFFKLFDSWINAYDETVTKTAYKIWHNAGCPEPFEYKRIREEWADR